MEDKAEVFLHTYDLEKKGDAEKESIKELEYDPKNGMLHSVHFGKPYH